MGLLGIAFALFTVGYVLGVWTGAMVFRQRQRGYEEGVPIKIESQGGRR